MSRKFFLTGVSRTCRESARGRWSLLQDKIFYAQNRCSSLRYSETQGLIDEREYEKALHSFVAMDRYLDSGGQAVEYVVKLKTVAQVSTAFVQSTL
jgi:hypothetical protein